MPRLTLDIVDEYPYLLYGINASGSDYRMCWNVNMALGIGMKLEKNLEIIQKKGGPSVHSVYVYTDPEQDVTYRLIQNRTAAGYVIPEAPKADYMILTDQTPALDPSELLLKLRAVKLIRLAFPMDIKTLKSKQNLLLTT